METSLPNGKMITRNFKQYLSVENCEVTIPREQRNYVFVDSNNIDNLNGILDSIWSSALDGHKEYDLMDGIIYSNAQSSTIDRYISNNETYKPFIYVYDGFQRFITVFITTVNCYMFLQTTGIKSYMEEFHAGGENHSNMRKFQEKTKSILESDNQIVVQFREKYNIRTFNDFFVFINRILPVAEEMIFVKNNELRIKVENEISGDKEGLALVSEHIIKGVYKDIAHNDSISKCFNLIKEWFKTRLKIDSFEVGFCNCVMFFELLQNTTMHMYVETSRVGAQHKMRIKNKHRATYTDTDGVMQTVQSEIINQSGNQDNFDRLQTTVCNGHYNEKKFGKFLGYFLSLHANEDDFYINNHIIRKLHMYNWFQKYYKSRFSVDIDVDEFISYMYEHAQAQSCILKGLRYSLNVNGTQDSTAFSVSNEMSAFINGLPVTHHYVLQPAMLLNKQNIISTEEYELCASMLNYMFFVFSFLALNKAREFEPKFCQYGAGMISGDKRTGYIETIKFLSEELNKYKQMFLDSLLKQDNLTQNQGAIKKFYTYLLAKTEQYLRIKSGSPIEIYDNIGKLCNSQQIHWEHIHPQSDCAHSSLDTDTHSVQNSHFSLYNKNSFGNATLLSPSQNSSVGNWHFSKKAESYRSAHQFVTQLLVIASPNGNTSRLAELDRKYNGHRLRELLSTGPFTPAKCNEIAKVRVEIIKDWMFNDTEEKVRQIVNGEN